MTIEAPDSERILLFIPAYNCANQIPRVLAQLESLSFSFVDEVLVVNNRSSDDTVAAACRAAESLKVPVSVVTNVENYGLGGSHKVAFAYASSKRFDYCIVLHGDDQGDLRDLEPLVVNGEHRKVDCLLGARFMPGSRTPGYSAFRTFGNRVFNALYSLAAGKRLFDLGSGLNLYKVRTIASRDVSGFANNLTFNYFLILASVHWRWKIAFFPITWREDDQISNVRLFRQSTQVLKILVEFFLRRGKFLAEDHTGRGIGAKYESVLTCANRTP